MARQIENKKYAFKQKNKQEKKHANFASKAIPMPRPDPTQKRPAGIPPQRPTLKKQGMSARGLGGMAKQFAMQVGKQHVQKGKSHVKGLVKGALKNQGKKMLQSITGVKME